MLHLTVTTYGRNIVPSVLFKQLQDITNFQICLREVWQAFKPYWPIKNPGAKRARINIDTDYLCLNGYVLLDHSRDRLFTGRTNHAFDFLAVTEEDQRRDALDSVTLCG